MGLLPNLRVLRSSPNTLETKDMLHLKLGVVVGGVTGHAEILGVSFLKF